MKKTFTFIFTILSISLLFAQKRNSNRYLKPFEVKSAVMPIYRFSQRDIYYELKDLEVPLTKQKINLLLDNRRKNANFDLLSELYLRAYCINFSYTMGAGFFDKHIFIKVLKIKNGDFSEVLKKTHSNHSFQVGVNYLGIKQLFKKVENTDFQFNASINAEFAVDFSDSFDMSEYINLFEYQNLPEFVIRNKKSFEQVQDFIIQKYSLPNSPLYRGVNTKLDLQYHRFAVIAQYHFLKNRINSRVSSFNIGAKVSF